MTLLILALACSPTAPDSGTAHGDDSGVVEIPDRYHLADGFIRDPQGRARVLRGVNVSNNAKDPATGFYGWHSAEDMQALADWGFDSVRLLTFWEAVEPEPGVIDNDYLDGLVERVQWASDAGLLVVLDMHQDLYGRGFGHDGAPAWTCDQALYDSYVQPDPWSLGYLTAEVWTCFDRFWTSDTLAEHYGDAWVAVAERVADQPAVIGFDLMNEPWPAYGDAEAFMASTLQDRYAQWAGRLGQTAPGKLVFVEPITMVQYGELDPGLAGIDDAEVVFGPHYYHPSVHEGEPYDGDPEPIDTAVAAFDAHAEEMGSTWWLGEWGGPDSADNIAAYFADIDARLLDRAVGSAMWSYDPGGGFAVMTAEGELRADIQQALQHPRVVAYGGDPGGASWDGSTLAFTVTARAGVEAESIVWVGEAAEVTVEGAESWSRDEGTLSITGTGQLRVVLLEG